MSADTFRHPDHRFEWTRAEFEVWAARVAGEHGYSVTCRPLGPENETYGSASQMAVFTDPAQVEAAK